MNNYLSYHRLKLILLLVLTAVLFIITSYSFEAKPVESRHMLDIIGEGGMCLCLFIWITIFLAVRPASLVTNLVYTGLLLLYLASLQDLSDEYFFINGYLTLTKAVESLPMIFGMVALTVGLFFWHKEQKIFNSTIERKEKLLREPKWIDTATDLYNTNYLISQLNNLNKADVNSCVMVVDIAGYDSICNSYGLNKSLKLVRDVSKLIEIQIPHNSLICRSAGETILILLTGQNTQEANKLFGKIRGSIRDIDYFLDVDAKSQINLTFSAIDTSQIDLSLSKSELIKRLLTHNAKHQAEAL